MKSSYIKLLFAAAAFLASACGTARRSEPFSGPLSITDTDVASGFAVFTHHCQRCHPGGEAGLAPSINDKPLPGFLIKFQVRHGMGDMPSFKKDKISEEELNQLVKYIKARKKNRPNA